MNNRGLSKDISIAIDTLNEVITEIETLEEENKRLEARIEELEAENMKLENKIEELEADIKTWSDSR